MSFNLNKLVQPECGAPNALVRAAQQISVKSTAPMAASVSRTMGPMGSSIAGPSSSQASQLNFAKEFAQHEPPPLMRMTTAPQAHLPAHSSQTAAQAFGLTKNLDQLTLNQHQPINYSMHSAATFTPHNQIPFQHQATTSGHQQQQQSQVSAGDQLEAKYRNDMISQTRSTLGDSGKLDDVEFWQSLSQTYIGPNTYDNIAKARPTNKQSEHQDDKTLIEKQKSDERNDREEEQDVRMREQQGVRTRKEQSTQLEGIHNFDYKIETDYYFDDRNPLKDQFDDPFTEGLKRLEQGDIPSAALLFEAAVQREPENALAWRYLGTTQAQNEQDELAIRALYNCLKFDNSDQQARLALSVSLANERRFRESYIQMLSWLINHDRYKTIQASHKELSDIASIRNQPRDGDDRYYGSGTSRIELQFDYIIDKFFQAARMSPDNPDPDVQGSLGVLFNISSEYSKAVDCFQAALSIKSDDSLLWNRLGATLANSNQCEEAVVAYKRALEISPGFLRSRYNLAISLIHLNLYNEAAKQLVQILNTQASGMGSVSGQSRARMGIITSSSIWNTLRTVATLMNRPDLYALIDSRNLSQCNEIFMSESGPVPLSRTDPSSSTSAPSS